jgi:hypothetical protein
MNEKMLISWREAAIWNTVTTTIIVSVIVALTIFTIILTTELRIYKARYERSLAYIKDSLACYEDKVYEQKEQEEIMKAIRRTIEEDK